MRYSRRITRGENMGGTADAFERPGKFGAVLVLVIAAFFLWSIIQGNYGLPGNTPPANEAGAGTDSGGSTGLATLQQGTGQAPDCTDSDSGKDYFVAGLVFGECADCRVAGTIGGNMDTCLDMQSVMEFYCTKNGWARETANCPEGCTDGACRH